MEPSRIEAYLRATCSVLDFDIGELWCAKKDKDNKLSLKFMQLYTSPTYKDFHSLLIQPDTVPNYSSESTKEHRFSPIICRSVCDGVQIVWANTKISGGLTGRSDLPLNTAVGIPVCSIANDLYILVLFAVGMVHMTHNSVEYLLSVVRAVTMNGGGFLSASLKLSVTAPITKDFVGQWDIADLIEKYSNDVDFKLIPMNKLQNYLDCHEILLFCDLFQDFKLTRKGVFTERQLESLREISKSDNNTITSTRIRSDSICSDAWGYDNSNSSLSIMYKTPTPFLMYSNHQQDTIPQYGAYYAQNASHIESILKFQSNEQSIINKKDPKKATVLNDSMRHVYAHVNYRESQSRYHEFMISILGMTVFSSAELWAITEDRSSLFLMAAVYRSTIMQKWIAISENIKMNLDCNDIATNILRSNNFVWDPDYSSSNDRNTGPRANMARSLGIATAFGVPVPGSCGIFGCMIFYSTKVNLELDPLIIQVLEKAVEIMSKTTQESLQMSVHNKSKLKTSKLKERNISIYHPAPQEDCISNTNEIVTSSKISSDSSSSNDNNDIHEQPLDFHQRLQICRSIFLSKKNLIEASQTPIFTDCHANAVSIYNQSNRLVGNKDQTINNESIIIDQNNNHRDSNGNDYDEEHVGLYINDSEIGFFNDHKNSKEANTSRMILNEDHKSADYDNYVDSPLSADSVINAAEALANFCRIPWNMPTAPALVEENFTIPKDSVPSSSAESNIYRKRKQFDELQDNKVVQKIKIGFQNLEVLNKCKSDGCLAFAENINSLYCIEHRSIRRCQKDGCTKCAQGATKYCISHGGGRRCTYPNCFKGARDKFFCAAHGGGRRCCFDGGCSKSAVGGSDLCTAHGGGKRCKSEGCMKSSQSSTDYCVKHGGGKSCIYIGCNKVARGKTDFCAAHGGGLKCISDGCIKLAIGSRHLCRVHNAEVKQNKRK